MVFDSVVSDTALGDFRKSLKKMFLEGYKICWLMSRDDLAAKIQTNLNSTCDAKRNHTGQFKCQKPMKNEGEGAAQKNIIERKFCVFQ